MTGYQDEDHEWPSVPVSLLPCVIMSLGCDRSTCHEQDRYKTNAGPLVDQR